MNETIYTRLSLELQLSYYKKHLLRKVDRGSSSYLICKMAAALKDEGNKLFAAKKFEESIEKFSQAIELDPQNHVLYSNRSGAYASLKDWEHALEDATKTTEIKADWSKGWGRKGTALHGAGDLGVSL